MEQVDPLGQILRGLKGQSDGDILAKIERVGGVDATLDAVFKGMEDAFRADRAGSRQLVIQYDIGTPSGTLCYQMELRDGTCHAVRGGASDPAIRVKLSFPNFLRLVMGNLRPALAYLTGKLKISGDLLLSAQLEGWFERPA